MTTTEGMADDYDHHSEYQRAVANTAAALIAQSVDAVPVSQGQTFVVADYGSSTGANSISALRTAIETARHRDPDRPVVAIHNDLPTNDWNQLFHNITSLPDSYLQLSGRPVLPLASAVSFFLPAAPARLVHLGVSFSAAHWLREQPTVVVPDGFYFCEATGEARTALAKGADTDWTAFLDARASDLAAGGRLLVQMVGSEPGTDGAEPNVTARKLLRAMAEVAADMAHDGALDPGAVERYVLPVYARTVDEARMPFAHADSPVHDAFTEIECRTDAVANPYFTKWLSGHDSAAYATSYAAFVRGFTESSLREHLFGPGATGTALDSAVGQFFTRLAARFAADPERDRFEDWTLTVVLERN
jgi:hypothetical protein